MLPPLWDLSRAVGSHDWPLGAEEPAHHPRDIVSRDPDVFELPVIQSLELGDCFLPLPAPEAVDQHAAKCRPEPLIAGNPG